MIPNLLNLFSPKFIFETDCWFFFQFCIRVVYSFKLLGITIDNNLNFLEYVSGVRLAINKRLFSIHRLFYLPFQVKLQVEHATYSTTVCSSTATSTTSTTSTSSTTVTRAVRVGGVTVTPSLQVQLDCHSGLHSGCQWHLIWAIAIEYTSSDFKFFSCVKCVKLQSSSWPCQW
jgi:hypothetical protein